LAHASGQQLIAVASVAELVAEKRRLRAQLVARFIAEHPELTESNLEAVRPQLSGGTLRWSYRRFDERLQAKVATIYPQLNARVAFALWTGSGMAAVSSALEALCAALPEGTPLHLPVDAYFETLRVAGRLQRLRPLVEVAPSAGSVLYLDSITLSDRTPASVEHLAQVVFDTTCYDAASTRIGDVVERCWVARVPCLLLRSHLKLDCLGLEYGRLGSVVVILPERPEPAQVALAKRLRSGVLDRLALTGGNFSPEALFPLAHDPEARVLNQMRNDIMESNHAYAGPLLKKRCAPTGVSVPHHGRFVILRPLLDSLWAGTRYLSRLVCALQQKGICAKEAPSFGYDLLAATLLRVPEKKQASIRLSLPDFDRAEIDRIVDIVAEEAQSWLPTREP
jgi:hypothetical protein